MAAPNPVPLYPTYLELSSFDSAEYPQLHDFLQHDSMHQQHWHWGFDFLKYTGRNKSEHTYTRFRNEIERFLLWGFLYKKKPIDELKKSDILDYADFCWQPPQDWIGTSNTERFQFRNGQFHNNDNWRPFTMKSGKHTQRDKVDKIRYKPQQATLSATFTAVIAFYKYLMNEEICYGNPAQLAKKDCRYFIKDAQVKDIKRLTEEQWQYVLRTAEKMADQDHKYERNLFIVAALKTLFLRISELSERHTWSPIMSHFWQDADNNWWLKVFGKGRKLRDITVPDAFIDYLKRYRDYRGQSPLPSSSDNSPLVEKIRGQGGMTARHLTRLVQEVFDQAYEFMVSENKQEQAQKLKQASSHWLRHTGASMEVERGRALKDLSEDLGHASMATTDTIYVQSENRKRARSGKQRTV